MKYIFGKQLGSILHGGDYNPDQWLDHPEILQKDIEYMKEAGINEATLGVFAWAKYEPREGEFHFEWLREVMDRLYENGIYTILATPSGARPAWMDLRYPEVMRADHRGVRAHHGFRHNHCMTSPLFREKIGILDRKLAEEFGDHPGLLMWHISNEFGGECYCEACKKKYQEYLRKRFHNDIDELNQKCWTAFWSKTYTSFDQIEPPYSDGESSVMGLNLEWKRFTTWNFTDYMCHEIDTIRKYSQKPEVPVTTNFMKRFWDIDYRVMAEKIDVISWDSYPMFHNDRETYRDTMMESAFDHAIMRSMKKDRPFMLMESAPGLVNWMDYNKLKRPGVHEQFAFQAVACGSDTVQYFQIRKARGAAEQFHGALIGHDGTDKTRVFREVMQTGAKLKAISKVEGSVMKNKAAVIFDWENWWAISNAEAFGRKTKNYDKVCQSYWTKLMEFDVEADVISSGDSFDDYRLIIAPMLYLLSEGVAGRLKEYVTRGGILLATYCTGYVNDNCLCYQGWFPGDGLNELFGIEVEEIDTLYPSDVNSVKGRFGEFVVKDYCDLINPTTAEVLGTYGLDFYEGRAALTVNHYGEGKAYYQAARFDPDGADEFIKALICDAGFAGNKLPYGLEHHARYGDGEVYDFYLNTSESDVEVMASGTDVISGETIGKTILKPKGYVVLSRYKH